MNGLYFFISQKQDFIWKSMQPKIKKNTFTT